MDSWEAHRIMHKITKDRLDKLSQEAAGNRKKRAALQLHNHTDPVLKLLNALEPETYIQPHKHFLKNCQELFVGLRGRLIIILFDSQGDIVDHVLIGPKEEITIFEVPEDTWHTILPLENGSLVMEVIKGPYKKELFKKFASWAPSEDDHAHVDYQRKLLKLLKLIK